ncbi:hypothetical protein [Roseateles amylovorans]|uniref:Uncharacterized protein n=1 Tax=Roseateles amylovorans TaxID=2978473 RepID=A0ABY6AYX0_9BURK|nr:hypothetical protein [Roseateles amylovorans]UXH77995.1 hypothetical protein N4261_24060 [Roseateles amylovorans]
MKRVIADAYQAFRRFGPPQTPLDACTACCMDPALELQMRTLPLRALTREHFYEYNSAAKSEVQPAAEIQYLLPRLLELIAQGEEVHHSIELFFDRVGRCSEGTFDASQRAVLDRFALEHFANHLNAGRERLLEDPLSILLMFDIGGLDIRPLLAFWLDSGDLQSTVQYVDERYWHVSEDGYVTNAFAEGRTWFQQKVRAWMMDPTNQRVFCDKLLRPEFLELIDQQPAWGGVPFRTVVDVVFDKLTDQMATRSPQ